MKTIALACMLMLGCTMAYAQGLSPDSDPAALGGPPNLKPPGLGPAPAATDSSGNPTPTKNAWHPTTAPRSMDEAHDELLAAGRVSAKEMRK